MELKPTKSFNQFWQNCQSGTQAEVILGSPTTRHCKNFGISSVSLEQDRLSGICEKKTLAYLRIDQPTNRLLVHFLSCSFNDKWGERFFARGNFQMDDDYILSKDISSVLSNNEVSISYRIEQGIYPMLIDEHFHTVSLRISAAVATQETMVLAA